MNTNGCIPSIVKRAVAGFILFTMIVAAFSCISAAAHYSRVHHNPRMVVATVQAITAEEDDDETKYTAYVSYTVDGQLYEQIEYSTSRNLSSLPPVGKKIDLQVSPEDPSKTLLWLQDHASSAPILILAPVALVGFAWQLIVRKRRSKCILHTPDEETIQSDLRLTVIGRFSLAFWLASALGTALVITSYPILYNQNRLLLSGACLVIWLLCLLRARRDLQAVGDQEYRVKRLNPPQNNAVYRKFQQEPWEAVPKTNAAQIQLEVYLRNKTKPELRYNANGDAL